MEEEEEEEVDAGSYIQLTKKNTNKRRDICPGKFGDEDQQRCHYKTHFSFEKTDTNQK